MTELTVEPRVFRYIFDRKRTAARKSLTVERCRYSLISK